MDNFKDGSLEITIKNGDTVAMSWLGRSESREPGEVLNPYLAKTIDMIAGKGLEIDFSSLDYMNSSTVPPIIQMIKMLDQKGIATRIYYNKESKWQAASFKALETISKSLKSIDVVGK